MDTKKYWLQLVSEEIDRATQKFGPFASAHEGYAVILEELDELWLAIKGGGGETATAAMEFEAVQVAAMAVRFMMDVCKEGEGDE